MAKRLFDLRNVPDDEADEVRALLTAHALDWYETRPGSWGMSAGGLWLRDKADYPRARRLLDEYQRQRRDRARDAAAGDPQPTFLELLRNQPMFVLPRLLAILAVLALTLALPWWLLR
ncbi:hypothetical protein B1992_11315 [Pseudoxanthomonas broegbernensis]|uniref:Transmembrane protein n=1 Tax=Pseudoxanthomonas broegbernensis TaxID=83619 RepID=A0A7V8K691_9GAMM|nr:DUF6164 family protein [Pseudoxanthomonas broegbernensis]KAF1685553.1 hypothetical protein B1992_11315 [Pseudoxanthomonas broegbernensis]MBB6065923.1 hypothetical protein [Pseudoxanthomonas broegbernensis]